MNKEELLKIYSAYLPYKTTITLTSEEYNYDGLTTILSPHYLLDWQRNKCKTSLHLWDLSYLTKEIDHEGEIFVPTERLMNYALNFGVNRGVFEHMLSNILDGKTYITELPYYLIIKLLEWHFNVFQLPESEYINKATLTNK